MKKNVEASGDYKVADMSLSDSEKEFEMHIMCDKEKNQLIIQV